MKPETKILKDRLEEIRNTLLELEFIKKDLKTLINSNEKHKKEVLSKSRYFHRLYLNYIRLFVIDIYKLIGEEEDYNIQKLLEFCKINIKKIEWHHSISLQKLNSMSERLIKISAKFKEIAGLRNKYYAHNDKKKHSYSYKISLSELWEILDELQKIFSELNVVFDNHHWIFDIQYNTPEIVQDLYKYKEIRQLTFKEYGDSKSTIETKALLDIIRG